jgi:hypothetical protein
MESSMNLYFSKTPRWLLVKTTDPNPSSLQSRFATNFGPKMMQPIMMRKKPKQNQNRNAFRPHPQIVLSFWFGRPDEKETKNKSLIIFE